MKPERAKERKIFLKRVGKLRKGWQDMPTRKLLRQRRVPIEHMRPKVSEQLREVTGR
jgi:hypothetical protein